MARCDHCGEMENLPYECRHCGGTYCSAHRLPENHDCPGLKQWNDPGGVFDSGFDDSVSSKGKGGSVTDRISLNTGTGGPFAYFRGNMTFLFLGLMWATFALQWIVATQGSAQLYETLFVLSSRNVEYVWTWITSIFSHSLGFGHIAVNSLVLYFFGPIVEKRVGSKKFAALFIISGMIAGLAQIGIAIVMGETAAVVGASGAIMAIMGVLTVLNPHLRVYLYFILPMPLWVLTIGFALLSVVFVARGGIAAGNVAHLAHLSGLFVGLGYGEKVKREGARIPEQLQFGGGGPGMGGRRRF